MIINLSEDPDAGEVRDFIKILPGQDFLPLKDILLDDDSGAGGMDRQGFAALPRTFEILNLVVRDTPQPQLLPGRFEEGGCIADRRARLEGDQVFLLGRDEIGTVDRPNRGSPFRTARPVEFT